MAAKVMLLVLCAGQLSWLTEAGGHGGSHKKVIIHVPYKVHHHHHKHTIVKHVHHKPKGGDDHYEVLGYTYGEPKAAPHFGGGHGWHAAEESDASHDSPISFGGDQGYGISGASSDHGYGFSGVGADHGYASAPDGGYGLSGFGDEHGEY